MFESVKELLSARETLEAVQEQIAESEAKLQELQEQLAGRDDPAAFLAEQGYALIELDPCFTLDGQCAILHDRTLNRTCRQTNGAPLE